MTDTGNKTKERQDDRGGSALAHPYYWRHDINMRQRNTERVGGSAPYGFKWREAKTRKRAENLTLDISHLNAVRVLPVSAPSSSPSS